jgi:hypothetical protein
VIRRAGRRLKGHGVRDALKAAGYAHSDATVRETLAALVRAKRLTGGRGPKSRGYGLPDWGEGDGAHE